MVYGPRLFYLMGPVYRKLHIELNNCSVIDLNFGGRIPLINVFLHYFYRYFYSVVTQLHAMTWQVQHSDPRLLKNGINYQVTQLQQIRCWWKILNYPGNQFYDSHMLLILHYQFFMTHDKNMLLFGD